MRRSFDEELTEEPLLSAADLHPVRDSQTVSLPLSLRAPNIADMGTRRQLLCRPPALASINPNRPSLVSHGEYFAITLSTPSKVRASTTTLAAFLATGSDICLIRSGLVDELGIRSNIQPQHLSSRLHNHTESVVIEGYVFLTWHPKDYPMLEYTSQLWVVPEGTDEDVHYDFLLGKPWINLIDGRSDVDRWEQWTKGHYAVRHRKVEA